MRTIIFKFSNVQMTEGPISLCIVTFNVIRDLKLRYYIVELACQTFILSHTLGVSSIACNDAT